MSLEALPPAQRYALVMRELARRTRGKKIGRYYPDAGPLRRELYTKHLAAFKAGLTERIRLILAANRVGKALRHGTRVATPTGWRPIEDLRVGDAVIAGDGSETRVVGVYPQGEVDLFAVSMDGVHDIVTCGEHLWLHQPPAARYPRRHSHGKWEANPGFGRWEVAPTRALAEYRLESPRQRPAIPMTRPFRLAGGTLPIDPYVLGALLGDGTLCGESIRFSSADQEIVDAIARAFPVTPYKGVDYGLRGAVPVIRSLGLHGTRSSTKFIPKPYLLASEEDRLALLQGLMDTDGTISGPGAAMEYATCSDALADGFEWLAASLGMKTRRTRRHTTAQNGRGLPSWRIVLRAGTTCPFRLTRKAARWRPLRETGDWLVHAVRPAGRGLATCIEVEHPSHTYVIEHGVVTHNTEGIAGYELTMHLTGNYPAWWVGRRWARPVDALAAGDTRQTTRDILQMKLLGPPGQYGTGMLPAEAIVPGSIKHAQGVPDAVESLRVRHASGGESYLRFRSYDQGREAFQGFEIDIGVEDEEPPLDIHSELLLRTMTTGGMLLLTFTPLKGVTPLIKFLREAGTWEIGITWDDAPHLTEQDKAEILKATPPHMRDARMKGVPMLGEGVVFLGVAEESIQFEAMPPVPPHWRYLNGLDFGWDHPTAGVAGVLDPDTDVLYITKAARERNMTPVLFAAAVRSWGDPWIPWAWPHDGLQHDKGSGEQLAKLYRDAGMNLLPERATFADGTNGLEAGVFEVYTRMQTGRLKVARHLSAWFEEFRNYHREKGQIVREMDDLLSATRYLAMMLRFAVTAPHATPLGGYTMIGDRRAGY